MNLKKFLLLFMSTILFFGLAACSSEETKSGESDSEEKVELRVAWWGGQARHDKMNELFDLFEEKNPNITVSREFTVENQYAEKFTTQAAGGNAPDVMQTSSFFQFD